MNTPALNRVLT